MEIFANDGELQDALSTFFASIDCYTQSIVHLEEPWRKASIVNGDYFEY